MSPEELKGMNGRRVLAEGVIEKHGDGYCTVQFDPQDDEFPGVSSCLVPYYAIREILPEPIKVGDRVRWVRVQGPCPDARVLAIHEGRAWVLYDDGRRDDWPLSDLTLVEPGQ